MQNRIVLMCAPLPIHYWLDNNFLRLCANFTTFYFCFSAMNSGKLLNGDLMYMTHMPPFTHFVPENVS